MKNSGNKYNVKKAKIAARTQRHTNRYNYKTARSNNLTERYKANKTAANIKEIGNAATKVTASITTPMAGQNIGISKMAGKSQDESIKKWNSLIDSNPTPVEGDNGTTQTGSTSSILGG